MVRNTCHIFVYIYAFFWMDMREWELQHLSPQLACFSKRSRTVWSSELFGWSRLWAAWSTEPLTGYAPDDKSKAPRVKNRRCVPLSGLDDQCAKLSFWRLFTADPLVLPFVFDWLTPKLTSTCHQGAPTASGIIHLGNETAMDVNSKIAATNRDDKRWWKIPPTIFVSIGSNKNHSWRTLFGFSLSPEIKTCFVDAKWPQKYATNPDDQGVQDILAIMLQTPCVTPVVKHPCGAPPQPSQVGSISFHPWAHLSVTKRTPSSNNSILEMFPKISQKCHGCSISANPYRQRYF